MKFHAFAEHTYAFSGYGFVQFESEKVIILELLFFLDGVLI